MLANYLIGLREGLEASLVVGILVSYITFTNRRSALKYVIVGVSAAALLSFGLGAFFTNTSYYLTFKGQELLGGSLSIVTASLVTWMIFWLAKNARNLKPQLEGSMDKAFSQGPFWLGLVAFLAVGREGLETALFVWTAIMSIGDSRTPLVGVLLGLATAVVVGYGIYKGSLKLNLAKFFSYTSFVLIFVAAGILAYGVHDLQEANVLPGLTVHSFDISSTISPDGILGTTLKGFLNFSPAPTVLETIVWVVYLAPVLYLLIRNQKNSNRKKLATSRG
ncbi:MAG: iron uptake transporter permease EfeU [Actinomycetota bacterium]